MFSHPALRAITWWDFSDHGSWLGAPAGLVRKDMSPKPVYTRLLELIHHQWWTAADGRTDQVGVYAGRVFYGEYQITVADGAGRTRTQKLDFPEAAPPLGITIRLP